MKSNPTKAVNLSSSQDIRNVLKSRDEASLQQGPYVRFNEGGLS